MLLISRNRVEFSNKFFLYIVAEDVFRTSCKFQLKISACSMPIAGITIIYSEF